jgi:hypothetical protein
VFAGSSAGLSAEARRAKVNGRDPRLVGSPGGLRFARADDSTSRRSTAIYEFKGSSAEYDAGLKLAIDRGWLWMHESGTFVRMTEAGPALLT